MTEADAIRKLRQGDRTGLSDLYAIYAHPAVGLAYSITGNKAGAEDAVQEAFLQVWRSVSSLRDPALFRPWFFRIVVNAAKRLSRNAYRSLPLDLSEHDKPDPGAPPPDEAVLEAEEVKLLWAAIAQLDEIHRVPVVLRYFTKLSEQEVAAALGIPPGTVKSRLHTARKLLRDCVESGVIHR